MDKQKVNKVPYVRVNMVYVKEIYISPVCPSDSLVCEEL